jgi:hypothetical protein
MKRFRGPIILALIGVVLAAIGGGMLVNQVVSLANNASLTQFTTPGDKTIALEPAEYAVYERVGAASSSSSSFESSTGSPPTTISSDQVLVTGPSGAVPVRCANCAGGQEELTLGSSVYSAISHFDVTKAGNYTVSVTGDGSRVAVAYSVTGVAGGVFGSLVPFALGGFLVFVAAIWTIILVVTGSRKEIDAAAAHSVTPTTTYPASTPGAVYSAAPAATADQPPAGWYPNPDDPTQRRWWTGSSWSDIIEK